MRCTYARDECEQLASSESSEAGESKSRKKREKGSGDALQLEPRSEGPRARWTGRGFRREG
jgi:hypothetical protein